MKKAIHNGFVFPDEYKIWYNFINNLRIAAKCKSNIKVKEECYRDKHVEITEHAKPFDLLYEEYGIHLPDKQYSTVSINRLLFFPRGWSFSVIRRNTEVLVTCKSKTFFTYISNVFWTVNHAFYLTAIFNLWLAELAVFFKVFWTLK